MKCKNCGHLRIVHTTERCWNNFDNGKNCDCKQFTPSEDHYLMEKIETINRLNNLKEKGCGKHLITARLGKNDGIDCGDFNHYIECEFYGKTQMKECDCFMGNIELCPSCSNNSSQNHTAMELVGRSENKDPDEVCKLKSDSDSGSDIPLSDKIYCEMCLEVKRVCICVIPKWK